VLQGRRRETAVLDQLLESVRTGESRGLVVRGDAGVGKSALLDYLAERASGCRVARATGVQSEMELAFAGLHQLIAPMLDRAQQLPAPQRDALLTAFGLVAGRTAPNNFLVGLAVIGLLSNVAADEPLVCLVDDAQWLDCASAHVLAFVGRRLAADSVALVVALREPANELHLVGFPLLVVDGLGNEDARALLALAIRWPLDERVRDRIVAETHGNPLALLELPRGLTPAQLAGGFGLPSVEALPGRIEASFARRLAPLPAATRRLLLLAAAEPLGDPVLLWRAADRLGIKVDAADAAESEGLVEFGTQVTFRHPLVRSAIYQSASADERREVHRVLAEATNPELDPDRRAWHFAQAAPGPDEEVASELERCAERARARGGLSAAAAFLERASALTVQPALRSTRALAAAQVASESGLFDAALHLLDMAEAGPLDELQRARDELLRGQIAFASSRGSDAPPLLLKAARRFEPLDVGLARQTHLEAIATAMYAGRFLTGAVLREAAAAARAAPAAPQPPSGTDLLMDGLAGLITDGYAASAPQLKRAVSAVCREDLPAKEALRWFWCVCSAAVRLWDEESWDLLLTRYVRLARDAGALGVLPIALNQRAGLLVFQGDFAAAAALVDEAAAITAATGSRLPPYSAAILAAFRGREREFVELVEACTDEASRRDDGRGPSLLDWVSAVFYNSVGRYRDALSAAQRASEDPFELVFSMWGAVELIEAAARSGAPVQAADALERLAEATHASGSDWALGIHICARALLSEGEAAERLYGEAIERLARTGIRTSLARAHLLYGEWLRREQRRTEARQQLHCAHDMFAAMGAEGFAERARRELVATGEKAARHTAKTRSQLTAREAQVAELAREGLSNPEIGARLFISPRTVEYHLRKVFTKLGIKSRVQLQQVLPGNPKMT
jgi:DNA-binding CsgD family transcriptional regulator